MNWPMALVLAFTLSHAAAAGDAFPPAGADVELDEITVCGSQSHLSELRDAMVEAEDRFYERYNALTPVDDFVVECRNAAPTGSQLLRRQCLARYEVQAHRDEGVEIFKILQFLQHNSQLMPASPPVPAGVAIEARRPEFKRNMLDTVQRHPELLQLLLDREKAIEQFRHAKNWDPRSQGDQDPAQHYAVTHGASTQAVAGDYLAVTASDWSMTLNLDSGGAATYVISSWEAGRRSSTLASRSVPGHWRISGDEVTVTLGGDEAGSAVTYQFADCLSYEFLGRQQCSPGLLPVSNAPSAEFARPLWNAQRFQVQGMR